MGYRYSPYSDLKKPKWHKWKYKRFHYSVASERPYKVFMTFHNMVNYMADEIPHEAIDFAKDLMDYRVVFTGYDLIVEGYVPMSPAEKARSQAAAKKRKEQHKQKLTKEIAKKQKELDRLLQRIAD